MSSRLGIQMPINTNMHDSESNAERGSISHSLSPLSHRPSNGMYQPQLPALQDPRYSAPSAYDHTSAPPSASSVYSPYSYSPATYQGGAPAYSNNIPSLSDSYSMNSDSSRPRIPSIHSPVTHHQANPISPSTSSIRTAYASATPHTARHQHRTSRDLQSPHSPMAPASNLRSPGSPPLRSPGETSVSASGPTGPPMGNTEILCNLFAADGALIEPEIIGRVEKGFFLADQDWTCYRRNYFTVVCSFSLNPSVHALPVLVKRTSTSQAENVTCFAMSISAVVDNPGGKTVELVQHTPKRDKGPQLKPGKLKLAPSQPSGKGFPPQAQQNLSPHGAEYTSFAQQPQQQQYVGSFERIQFKSATANNGKRRAAQQYYHLIIELYADVSNATSGAPPQEAQWVKVARKVSAPMVVRGRSPGHYADGGRLQSPGGNSGSGSGSNNPQSPNSNGNTGMMGGPDMNNSHSMMGHSSNGMNMGNMNGYHNANMASNYTSPSPSSIRDPSIATPPPLTHLEGPPIDPIINGEDNSAIGQDYTGYQYFHEPIYQGEDHQGHQPHGVNMYEDNYPDERKSEGPVVTNCLRFDEEISSYIPNSQIGKENTISYFRKYRDADGSRGYYPDLPTV